MNSGPSSLFSGHKILLFSILDSFQDQSCFLTGNPDCDIHVHKGALISPINKLICKFSVCINVYIQQCNEMRNAGS